MASASGDFVGPWPTHFVTPLAHGWRKPEPHGHMADAIEDMMGPWPTHMDTHGSMGDANGNLVGI